MKYIIAIYLTIFLGGNNSKINAKEINNLAKDFIAIETKIKAEKKLDLGVTAVAYQELSLTLKNSNKLIKARYFIRKNKLIWNGLKSGSNGVKIIFVKVPDTKTGYWIKRLRASNLFSSVKVGHQSTITKPIIKTSSSSRISNTSSSRSSNTNSKKEFIKVRKAPCHGDCETFEAVFYNDGKVIFKGIKNVSVIGEKVFNLTSEELRKVKNLFNSTNFKNYRNSFSREESIAFPSTFITYQNKQVEVKLWKNAPFELAIANDYLETILVNKHLLQ